MKEKHIKPISTERVRIFYVNKKIDSPNCSGRKTVALTGGRAYL